MKKKIKKVNLLKILAATKFVLKKKSTVKDYAIGVKFTAYNLRKIVEFNNNVPKIMLNIFY